MPETRQSWPTIRVETAPSWDGHPAQGSDTIAGCVLIECGALPPVDGNGNRRKFYVRWFSSWAKHRVPTSWSTTSQRAHSLPGSHCDYIEDDD
jgi:hypothetical protein